MAVVQKVRSRVDRLVDHGDHVHTVELATEVPVPRFRAGQFLHLALDEYEPGSFWPESRVFSIASPPEERRRLLLCYSARGRFTRRMEAELSTGRSVWVKLPYGDFVVDGSRPAVLFAGGTGITAFTTFVLSLGPGQQQPVLLAYGARRPGLLVFREALERRAESVSALKLLLFSEQPGDGVETGCLAVDRVWVSAAGFDRPLCYLSGPPAMIRTVRDQLTERGVPTDDIRVDAWE